MDFILPSKRLLLVNKEASPAQRVSWQTSGEGCSVWPCRCPPWSHQRCESGSSWGYSPVRETYYLIITNQCAWIKIPLKRNSIHQFCMSHVNSFSLSSGCVRSLWITAWSALLAERYSWECWVGGKLVFCREMLKVHKATALQQCLQSCIMTRQQ